MRMFVYPYHAKSMSAKAVAEAMGGLRIRRSNSTFTPGPDKVVVNWGCTRLPDAVMRGRVLNLPAHVARASNKLRFFQTMADAGHEDIIPEFTTDRRQAEQWVADAKSVFCRTKLSSHSGRGIVIAENGKVGDVVDAPLYTVYVRPEQEYRIYVVNGKAVDAARKARRLACENPNWKIRSWHNGFVFARKSCDPDPAVADAAIKATAAVGLDFAAVDVIWSAEDQRAVVLEVNTAPGIEGRTIKMYANELKAMVGAEN